MMSDRTEKTRRMVGLSIFTALVIVLQYVASFIQPGGVSITLALTPIVVGAAMYGLGVGAWLGGVFGAVVLVSCITGVDLGGGTLWNLNPAVTGILCLAKGICAGLAASAVYRAVSRRGRGRAGVVCAAVVSPVVNTGMFILALVLFFYDTLTSWALGEGYENIVLYIFLGLAGVNFLIELGINLVLSPIVERVISARRKGAI